MKCWGFSMEWDGFLSRVGNVGETGLFTDGCRIYIMAFLTTIMAHYGLLNSIS